MRNLSNYIGGWVESESEEFEPVFDPASGEELAFCPHSTRSETARAIDFAARTFETFRHTSVLSRTKMLFRLHQLLIRD